MDAGEDAHSIPADPDPISMFWQTNRRENDADDSLTFQCFHLSATTMNPPCIINVDPANIHRSTLLPTSFF